MQVITGSSRGRKLETLPGNDITRPTAQNVKEAVFSMIQFEIVGKSVLDLFAGSAQLGIEALSRGANFCTFVESNNKSAEVAMRNIDRCRFRDKSKLIIGDALLYRPQQNSVDIVFMDPPYNSGYILNVLPNIENSIKENGIVICETLYNEMLPQCTDNLFLYRERKYSKTKITLYRKKNYENSNLSG